MKVTPIYPKVVPSIGVTIELSKEEATALKEVLGSISGDPEHPIRLAMTDLFHQLDGAGIETTSVSSFMPGYHTLRVKDVT